MGVWTLGHVYALLRGLPSSSWPISRAVDRIAPMFTGLHAATRRPTEMLDEAPISYAMWYGMWEEFTTLEANC